MKIIEMKPVYSFFPKTLIQKEQINYTINHYLFEHLYRISTYFVIKGTLCSVHEKAYDADGVQDLGGSCAGAESEGVQQVVGVQGIRRGNPVVIIRT